MIIDTHSHLNFNAFKGDADEVIRRTLDSGVHIINVGSQYSTSCRAKQLAEKYPQGVFAAVGLHPFHLETGLVKIKNDPEEIQFETRGEEFDYEKYKTLASSSPKVVAVGEIGLDYWRRPKTKKKLELFKQKQKDVFLKQLELARELNLPAILHCRLAYKDMIDYLKKNSEIRPKKAVIHCFTGDGDDLKEFLNFGFRVGFNGIIFKKIEGIDFSRIVKETPLDRILLETDCPYLTPSQKQGERNEPIFIKFVAERIAELKNVNREKLEEIVTQNARDLFFSAKN